MRLRGLRQVRQRRGMSISQLAELSDIRRENITRLEHGQEINEPALVRRLSLVLEVTQRELVTGFLIPSGVLQAEQLPAV